MHAQEHPRARGRRFRRLRRSAAEAFPVQWEEEQPKLPALGWKESGSAAAAGWREGAEQAESGRGNGESGELPTSLSGKAPVSSRAARRESTAMSMPKVMH